MLILLFCLFFTVLAQSLILLPLPCCALYLSMVHLLKIWLTLPGSWPYILHSGFKSFLPSIFTLIYLVWIACSFVAIIKVLLWSSFHKPLTIYHHLFMSCLCCSSSFHFSLCIPCCSMKWLNTCRILFLISFWNLICDQLRLLAIAHICSYCCMFLFTVKFGCLSVFP